MRVLRFEVSVCKFYISNQFKPLLLKGGGGGGGSKILNRDDCEKQGGKLLKVPKHENFLLAFFALSEPIWVCDLGSGEKNRFFLSNDP